MPTSTWRLRVVWRFAMSIVPSAMPFHTDDEPMRNHGSTDLVVRRGAVADRADELLAGDLDVRDLERPRLVAAQSERVPERRLRLRRPSPSITNTERSS